MSEEKIKKSLLIIKANPTSLTTVESFLKNREWKIKSTTNIKEALVFLVQEQPQFVLVCIDHPNQKVRKLPKVLTQAFPVCVIAFTEGTSSAAYGMLNATATEYLLYPPVTGPAVERTVNKYYKDQQTKSQNPTQLRSSNSNDDNVMYAVRGDGQGFSPQNAQSFIASMLNDEGGDVAVMSGATLSALGMASEGIGAGALHSTSQGSKELSDDPNLRTSQKKHRGGHWAPMPDTKRGQSGRLTPEQIEAHPQATKCESIILRGTKDALEKACRLTSFENSEAVQQSTNVACIVVESPRFSGYLITAMGKNRSLDSAFLEKVRERLFTFLKNAGEKLNEGDAMELKIQQVPFEDWALVYAEFMRKSIHDGNEVVMAYFPHQDIKIKVEDSPAEDMASIKIDELQGDVVVEFNVYLHLSRNNKYVLYTPRGSVFYSRQKERLQSLGITQLHILKMDLLDVDRYRAQNFLNEKIIEFEEHEKSTTGNRKEKKPA